MPSHPGTFHSVFRSPVISSITKTTIETGALYLHRSVARLCPLHSHSLDQEASGGRYIVSLPRLWFCALHWHKRVNHLILPHNRNQPRGCLRWPTAATPEVALLLPTRFRWLSTHPVKSEELVNLKVDTPHSLPVISPQLWCQNWPQAFETLKYSFILWAQQSINSHKHSRMVCSADI